jgi:hypothetical protein
MTTGSGGTRGVAAGPGEPADTAAWQTAWHSALGALELEVDAAEQLLRQPVDAADLPGYLGRSFQPPPGLGPLPMELADRARRLLERQLELAEGLTTAMQANRAQAMLAKRMRADRSDPRPVFVDRAG